MKKQQKERTPRYRFWRNVGIITVSGLIGGVISFLTETNYRLMGPVQYSTYKEGALSGITYSALLTYEKRQQ